MAADRQRPVSPHLQIYRLPMAAVLSITHRITGIALALGALLMVLLLIAAASGSQVYTAVYPLTAHWLGQIVLFAFTLALYYHLCAGIRHLFWDAGYGYELATVRRTSWLVLGSAGALTVLTWIVALAANGS